MPLDAVEVRRKNKDPGVQFPGSFLQSGDGSDLGRSLRHRFLDRLVGIARNSGIHFAELRCLGNPGVVRLLGILRLNFAPVADFFTSGTSL